MFYFIYHNVDFSIIPNISPPLHVELPFLFLLVFHHSIHA